MKKGFVLSYEQFFRKISSNSNNKLSFYYNTYNTEQKQYGTKRTIYRMGGKSCDTCLDPGKLQDLKEYPNPKDP